MTLMALTGRNVEEAIKKNLQAILVDMPKYKCMVGIPGGETNSRAAKKYKKEAEDIATYAAKNEFGSFAENIPARPFLRTTMQGEHLKKIEKAAAGFLHDCAFDNRSAFEFLSLIGIYAAGEVKRNITDGEWTPNAPLTIALKKSDKPLIDTGTMRRSVTAWVIEKEAIA